MDNRTVTPPALPKRHGCHLAGRTFLELAYRKTTLYLPTDLRPDGRVTGKGSEATLITLDTSAVLSFARPLPRGFLEIGAFALECGDGDVGSDPRARRHADLRLGAADAAVFACAERNGGRVVMLDADFLVVAKERKISVQPG